MASVASYRDLPAAAVDLQIDTAMTAAAVVDYSLTYLDADWAAVAGRAGHC